MDLDKGDDFCLKWNNHHSTFMTVLHSLMQREVLVDVTLAAEGKFIEAHKLVLCTCSDYFQEALTTHDNKQAYIFLNNIAFDDLQALICYMYKGEVNVSQDQLPRFLAAAEALKIKGLSDKPGSSARDQEDGTDFQPRTKRLKANSGVQRPQKTVRPSPSPLRSSQQPSLSPSMQFAQASNSSTGQQDPHQQLTSPGSPAALTFTSDPAEQDDNFISVNASEEEPDLEPREDDGLGTLGKVWSISQENGHSWNERTEPGQRTTKTECYVPHLAEPDMTDNSIDYRNYSSSSLTDTTASMAGIEEVLPGLPPSHLPTQVQPTAMKVAKSNQSATASAAARAGGGASSSDITTGQPKMVCPTCGRHYTQKGSLNRHVKFECGMIPKFACQICPMRFRRAYKLTEHYNRIHGSSST